MTQVLDECEKAANLAAEPLVCIPVSSFEKNSQYIVKIPITHDVQCDRLLGMEFVFASISGMGAGVCTNPLEVLKTRLQLQGELEARGSYKRIYNNTFHAAYLIARHEGIWALQSGIVPCMGFQICLNGFRLGIYHMSRRYGITLNENGQTSVVKTALFTGCAGAFGAVVGSPFYLVKTQLQSQAVKGIAVGYQHHHSGAVDAFRHLWREGGFSNLYRGWYAVLPKSFLGSATQLTIFAVVCDWLRHHKTFKDRPLFSTFVGSLISGCCVAVVMQPFDVIATRIFNQGVINGKGMYYSGIFNALHKVFIVEGYLSLYKGIVPSLMRGAFHVVCCQCFYEQLSQAYDNYSNALES